MAKNFERQPRQIHLGEFRGGGRQLAEEGLPVPRPEALPNLPPPATYRY
jgi:hypothetical protein